MKKFKGRGLLVKALSVLLVAGLLVSGVKVAPKADVVTINVVDDGGNIIDSQIVDAADLMTVCGYMTDTVNQAQAFAIAACAQKRAAEEQAAAEELARQQQAAAEEAARKMAEEAERQRAAEEEAERQRAAEELARQQQAAAEEAARKMAEEAERQRVVAEEAARQAAEEEAARKAAEEEANKPVKRDTPNAGKSLLNGHMLTDVPANSQIWYDGMSPQMCAGGNYVFSESQYNDLAEKVRYNIVEDVYVKAIARNEKELDSDVQVIRAQHADFPEPQKTKRSIPNAKFEASTSVLSNLDCAKYSVDGGSSWSSDQVGETTISGVHPDLEIRIVNSARTEDELDSDIQTIWIRKADRPTGVTGVAPEAMGGKGKLVNVSGDEEYCVSGTGAWVAIGGSAVDVDPGAYDVRVRAHSTLLASDSVTVTVPENQGRKEDKPNASFDGPRLNLYNINVGCAYTVDDANWITITDAACTNVTLTREAAEKAVHGNGIRVKRLGNGRTTLDSDVQTISIAEAVKPYGISTTPATNGNNGSIINVAADMQYCKEGGSWNDIGSNKVTGLTAGKYFVRRKGAGTTIPSEAAVVVVDNRQGPTNKQPTPNADFNAWNMTLSGINGCIVSFDGGNSYSKKLDKDSITLGDGDVKADKGIKIIRCGDSSTLDSDVQTISLSKMPVPTGVSATSATAKTGGMINGVNSNMEFRAANGSTWVVPSGNTIAGLAAGTYYVRTKGQYTSLPSDVLVISIQLSTTPTVVQPTTSNIIVQPIDDKQKEQNKKESDKKEQDKKDVEKAEEAAKEAEESAKEAEEAAEIAKEAAEETEGAEQAIIGAGPIVLAELGEQGWGAIEAIMEGDGNKPVAIDLTNASTVVPAAAISTAATSGRELILDISQDMAWSIMPTEITSAGNDIDLGIKENTNDIPRDVIAKVEVDDDSVAKEFSINHEGDFGFTAHLTVALGAVEAGKTAKLYYYNKATGAMEVVDTAVVNSYGEATFALTHASSYAVTLNSKVASVSPDDSKGTTAGVTDKSKDKKSSSRWWIWVIVAAVILTGAACGVVVYLKQKEEEAKRKRHHASQNHGDSHGGTNRK